MEDGEISNCERQRGARFTRHPVSRRTLRRTVKVMMQITLSTAIGLTTGIREGGRSRTGGRGTEEGGGSSETLQ
eukprot:4974485-Pyramimonas_sp.AAC.1